MDILLCLWQTPKKNTLVCRFNTNYKIFFQSKKQYLIYAKSKIIIMSDIYTIVCQWYTPIKNRLVMLSHTNYMIFFQSKRQ